MAVAMKAAAGAGRNAPSSSTDPIDALRREAAGGDPSAQYRLAHLYAVGHTVPHDPAQARRWMTQAAENGEIDACFELGLIHAASLDREDDVAAAFRWLQYAAASGHARAAQELAILRVRAMETRQGLAYLAEKCGDVAAQFALARAYAAGGVVAPDAAEARRWLTAAAEGGHVDACFELGLAYFADLNRPDAFAGSLHWLERAADAGHARAAQELEIVRIRAGETSQGLSYLAEQGDAQSQYALAKAYMIGAIVPRDLVRAHDFMQAAAERGHSQACLELGLMYAAMPEGDENLCTALDWVRRAAAAGHPRAPHELQILQRRAMETPAGLIYLAEKCNDVSAQLRLANVYAAGEMVPSDPVKAQHWMRTAAEHGDVEAVFNLGLMCAAAIDVKGNFARAHEWLTCAHEAGHPRAGQELAMLRARGMETPEGLPFLAERGDAVAQLKLAERYVADNGSRPDPDAAFKWLQRAAELGEVEAQYRLGVALAAGAGTARDQAAARLWLTRAADAGHADAPTELDALSATDPLPVPPAALVAERDTPVLMGTGAFADRFASILRRHGVPVIDGSATPPQADTSAPLFVTDGLHFAPTGQVTCDVAAYEHALRDAVARFPHARIRHPASAHDLLGLQYKGSAGLFGLPGSGNTIFMTVVEELQRLARCRLSRDQEFFRMLSAQHMELLPATLERNVAALSEWTPLLSNQRPGRTDIAWVPKRNGAGLAEHLFGLPCINYALPCVVSHGIDAASLKRLDEHGITSFLIVRNPLDTIHSLLNKYKKPLEQFVHDYEAFDLLIQGVVAYLGRIARNEGRRVLKYEMLLTQFEAQAASLAEKLGLECDPAWFGQLKDKLLFKNLVPNDPLHFRGGQSGRWRDALNQRHFDIARGRGLFDVMTALDYPLPLREEFRAQPVDDHMDTGANSLRRDLCFFHHLIDVPLPPTPDPAYARIDGTDVALRFEDGPVRNELQSLFQTPLGRTLLDLGTVPDRPARLDGGHRHRSADRIVVGPDVSTRAGTNVLIGAGAFASRFASILRRHGVSVMEAREGASGEGMPATLFVTGGLDFTPTGRVTCDFARYADAIEDAAARFPGAQVRHPGFAHDLLGLRYDRSAALFGLPGSGNTLCMKVVEDLQKLAGHGLTRDQEFFRDLAQLHVDFVISALRRAAPGLAQWRLIASNQRLGVFDIGCVSEADEADPVGRLRPGLVGRLFELSRLNHAAERFVSHGFDEAGLERLDYHGFTSFLVVRDPLDTIHSLLSKYDRPLGPVVRDYDAFDLLVQGMVVYLTRVATCSSRHSLIKYETVLADFESQARMLSDKLGLGCDPNMFEEMKSRLLFRNLGGDPRHFRGGLSGRWKNVLDQRHHDILRSRGMFDVMQALGYVSPDSGEFRRDPLSETATKNLHWDLYFFHHLIDVPLPDNSDPAYGRVAGTNMAFHIEDETVRRQLTTRLQTTAGQVLLNLMG